MKIDVKPDMKGALNRLGSVKKGVKFAASKAINDTMDKVEKREVNEIRAKVDRPKSQTLKAYYTHPIALKTRLHRTIRLKRTHQFLRGLIEGGGEGMHYVSGKRAKVDQYGNLPRGATGKPNTFSRTIKGQSGVWMRTGGNRAPKVHLVAHFPSSRKYKQIIDFYGVATKMTMRHYPIYLRKAMAAEMRKRG